MVNRKTLSHNIRDHNLIYFKLGITVGNAIMRTGSLLAFARRAFLLNVTAVTEKWHRDHVNQVRRRRTGVKSERGPVFLRFQGVSPRDLYSARFIQSLSTHATRRAKSRHQRSALMVLRCGHHREWRSRPRQAHTCTLAHTHEQTETHSGEITHPWPVLVWTAS